MTDTNITPEHKAAFESLLAGESDSENHVGWALFSCFVNGEPSAAIVWIERQEQDFMIEPVFVAVTPGMEIVDHDGKSA